MQKLLIAEHANVLTERLRDMLRGKWEIYTCEDGYTAVDMLRRVQPDAMIIDLNLSQKDGFAVLEECFPMLPPVILGLTTFVSPYIERIAESFGVGYILRIPCDIEVIGERLANMTQAYISSPAILLRYLHTLGFNTGLDGYRFLLAAIPMLADNHTLRLHKEVYPEVALCCAANDAKCVERSIRTSVHDAWVRRNTEVWSWYFTPNAEGEILCPSNKAFISAVAEKLSGFKACLIN